MGWRGEAAFAGSDMGGKGAWILAGDYSIVVCGWSEFERYWEKKFMGVRLWLVVTAAEEELSWCF
jgi:hypothetical protein